VEAVLAEDAGARRWRQQHVVFGEVEAVGGGEAVVAVGALATGLGRVVERVVVALVGRDVVGHAGVRVGDDEASARRARAAERQAGAWYRKPRLLAGVGRDRILLDMAGAEE